VGLRSLGEVAGIEPRGDNEAVPAPPTVVQHAGKTVLFAPASVRGPSIGSFLRRGEFYESQMLEHIRRLDIRGNYVDAGAAIGNHTLFFSVICGADHVDAFEPRDWVFDLLLANVRLNQLTDRVTPHMVGLAGADGETTTVLDRQPISFPVRRLDDLVHRRVALLKIDVEDMEVEVIRGAQRILRVDRPLVFAEARTPELYLALAAALRDSGYRPTGRVFNSTDTYEFVARPGLGVRVHSSLRARKRDLVTRSDLARRLLVGAPRRLRRLFSSTTRGLRRRV
jgi:FkbM family methyltransferase